MATKKKLLQAAAGTAAASGGAGGLNVEQVFSTYLYEGNGSFQAIGNGIKLGQSGDGGSVLLDAGQNNYLRPSSNSGFALGTGAFTIEAFYFHRGSTGDLGPQFFDWDGTSSQLWFGFYGTTLYLRTASNSDLTASLNQQVQTWTHVAAVRDSSGNMSLYHNGTRVASGTGFNATNVTGTQPYIGSNAAGGTTSYTDGFLSNIRISNTARYSGASITVPTSGFTSDSDTVLLTAQGDSPLTDNSSNALTITTNGDVTASTFGPFDAASAGEGGMVWIKQRTNAYGHYLYDTERGVQKGIASDSTAVEQTGRTGVTSFNSNGFSLGNFTYENGSGNDIASWTFRKAPKFFDVVTYTGDGTAGRTVSHNLGTTVGTIIIKDLSTTWDWQVYHRSASGYGALNNTDAWSSYTGLWNSQTPTSTEFYLGSDATVNTNGNNYVAYLFAHNDGDGEFGPTADQDIIKCGSYTGNGSTNGPEINLGFEPQWLLYKNTSTGGTAWVIVDNMRGIATGGDDALLQAQTSGTELSSGYNYNDLQANGFKVTTTADGANTNGNTYIYIAIRRGPMAVPTAATDVFSVKNYVGTTTSAEVTHDVNFDLEMSANRDAQAAKFIIVDKLRSINGVALVTSDTASEATYPAYWSRKDQYTMYAPSAYDDWWASGSGSANHISYGLVRAPSFCDVVAYTGNGTAGRTVSHNLGVAPEMMWLKPRSTGEWVVYHKDLGATHRLHLDKTNASAAYSGFFNDTAPTDSVFTLGSDTGINGSGSTYIAYLFASLDGVSKVGSITGTGSDQTIDCGFSNGARFVLIKRTSSTSNWWLFDTERGIAVGNDPILRLDTTEAEGSSDIIDPHSSGFTINSTFAASGVELIFYAIA